MPRPATFRVDPRLASLLGESYRSTEQALKELIDNAWDADAENVWITLPEPLTLKPIVVKDDGAGMSEREVRSEYLSIASDRRARKGLVTPLKKRSVKGRKGIGKFAGLVAAEIMDVETQARGKTTTLRIVKHELLGSECDLEKVKLAIHAVDSDPCEHGTTITLSQLSSKFSLPQPEALRELLALEYGRERDFTIYVNGEQLAHEDIPGQKFTKTVSLPNAGTVTINFTILDKPTQKTHAGIVMRVGGKVVGRPTFLGLDDDKELPSRLFRQVVGEVVADSLEEDVTADWGAIIENSVAYQEAREWVRGQVHRQIEKKYKADVKEELKRQDKVIKSRLSHLPEHRRAFAEQQIQRVLKKFYGESPDRIDTVVSLMLDAMEKDEYWLVCQKLEQAKMVDVAQFASALGEFGLVDLSVIALQTRRRLEFLDYLDELARNKNTLEKDMHSALDKNLWVFGSRYSVMASNQTLAKTIEDYTGKKFKGSRAKKRPDLFLAQGDSSIYLLIEFKKPSQSVGRDAEAQAKKYRDDLSPIFGRPIEIVIVGGKVDSKMFPFYQDNELKFLGYNAVIGDARRSLQWLLKELTTESNLQVA